MKPQDTSSRMFRARLRAAAAVAGAFLALVPAARSAAPPLKPYEIKLNSTASNEWTRNGGATTVPDYQMNGGAGAYERSFTVPSAWAGKRVHLQFQSVLNRAVISVGTSAPNIAVATNYGAHSLIDVDITAHVTAGGTYKLKVDCSDIAPMKDASGMVVWPIGGHLTTSGINDDVWLRAYGPVSIEDAHIKTSWAAKTLDVVYTLRNSGPSAQSVTLSGSASPASGGAAEKEFTRGYTLGPGETREVTVSEPWANPAPYLPDDPKMYHLTSILAVGGIEQDRETRRFGFREITIQGNQFFWNGIRVNLYGDYQSIPDTWYVQSSAIHNPTVWPATVDNIKSFNIRVLRWHHNPPPQFILDVMDEKGLLACAESPNYARSFLNGMTDAQRDEYVNNFFAWVRGWIVKDRNHPCIYVWGASNEMTWPDMGKFRAADLQDMGAAIRDWDDTRPICYDGDRKDNWYSTPVPAQPWETYNWHYPEGYNAEPSGDVYGAWNWALQANRPTGSGEMLHAITSSSDPAVKVRMERNKWWLGIWTRGLRYSSWTDVRPACWWFATRDATNSNPAVQMRGINLRNCYAPVALFDKAYDRLGIAPFVTGTNAGAVLSTISGATLNEGATAARTLVLYNDEFRGSAVTVEIQAKIGPTVHASGTQTYHVPLGSHIELASSFQVPKQGGQTLDWVLVTRKSGIERFRETRQFYIAETGQSGTTSSAITLPAGTGNQQPSVSMTSPASGAGDLAPATVVLSANAGDADGIVERVKFHSGTNVLAEDTSAPYTYHWAVGAPGSFSVTATAVDNDGAETVSAPVAITVSAPNAAPTVSITAPSAGASFTAPAAIAVTAAASDTDGTVSKVEFFASGGKIGEASSAPFTVTWTNAAVGVHTLSAQATDDDGATALSEAVNITVTAASGGFSGAKINFQPLASAVPPDYDIDAGNLYGARTNGQSYGWSQDVTINTRDRGAHADQRYDTCIIARSGTNGAQHAWEHALPNGTYNVRLVCGDASYTDSTHNLAIEGTACSDPTPNSGNFEEYNVTVEVSDGKLTLVPTGGNVKYCFVEITPVTAARKINFQPLASAVPPGYDIDAGNLYGARTNGQSYGWSQDVTINTRDRGAHADQRYDTCIIARSGTNGAQHVWEHALPNGTYNVRLVCGDASFTDSTHNLAIEGTACSDPTPNSGNFEEYNVTVEVSDGKLTLVPTGGNVKYCFLEVSGG